MLIFTKRGHYTGTNWRYQFLAVFTWEVGTPLPWAVQFSHLSCTEMAKTWSKLQQPTEPFESRGIYMYIIIFISKGLLWGCHLLCDFFGWFVFGSILWQECVCVRGVGLECGQSMIAWRLWGLMMVEECNFVNCFFLFWQAVYFLGVLDAFALFMSTRGHSQRIITPELIAGSSFMDMRL